MALSDARIFNEDELQASVTVYREAIVNNAAAVWKIRTHDLHIRTLMQLPLGFKDTAEKRVHNCKI